MISILFQKTGILLMFMLYLISYLSVPGDFAETELHPLLHHHRHEDQPQPRKNVIKDLLNIVKPEQIHISFGEKVNDIVVVWATKTKMAEPYVEVGSDGEWRKVTAETVVFKENNNEGTKYWQRAYLQDLKEGEKYYYRVNTARGAGLPSNQLSFTVPSGAKKRVHSVMILADMGLLTKSLNFLVEEAVNGGYESVIHIGDIGNDLHRGEGSVGDQYLQKIQKMAAQVPYMTCPGDQERFHHYIHYRYRFSMPGSQWPMSEKKLWYSYNLGVAHFIIINTDVLCRQEDDLKAAQLEWIKSDLMIISNDQRPRHPWVVMLGHKPMYSTCAKGDEQCAQEQQILRDALDDILFKYGVDLYIAGHQHNYERSWPVYRGQAFNTFNYKHPKAPIHMTIGSMGAEYHQEKFPLHGETWSALRFPRTEKELFSKLDVINASHLFWEVVSASNNEKVDRIWIVQNSHGTFGKPGPQAYKRVLELQNIALRPPLPLEYHERFMRNNQPQHEFPHLVIFLIPFIVVLLALILSGKLRKCTKTLVMIFRGKT